MAGHEQQALWALAAGELDASGRARVEAHVAGCAACAEELKRVVDARSLLHTARAVEPAVRWDETRARLRTEAAKRLARPERHVLAPWALTLAGACAVALLVWWVGARWMGRPTVMEAPRDAVASDQQPGERPRDAVNPGVRPVEAPRDAVNSGVRPAEAPLDALARAPGARPGEAGAPSTEAEQVAGAMLREAGGPELALTPGMRVRSGMAVRTPVKASAVLRLPDASRVRLSAGSDVVFARAESRAVHLTVRQGRLSVSASHAQREGFLVESAGMRVSVVGTVFSVERTSRGAAVAVLEGRVRVDAEGQPPRFVDAGERVELSEAGGALKPRTISEADQQAFQDLRAAESVASVTPAPPPTVDPTPGPSGARVRQQAVATAPKRGNDTKPPLPTGAASNSTNGAAPGQAVTTAQDTAPRSAGATVPDSPQDTGPQVAAVQEPVNDGVDTSAEAPRQSVASAANPLETDEDFAPYPGGSRDALAAASPQTGPGSVQAPSVAPTTPAPPHRHKSLGMLVPGGLLSDDSDERFLGYARVQQSSASTCGRFLVGLGEIAAASPRGEHREQARALRGRCFTKQRQFAAAEDEYRQYLREFPNGRYAGEARLALGLPEADPRAPASTPEPLPAPTPVTPRWNTPGGTVTPQRVPASPGVPRRW